MQHGQRWRAEATARPLHAEPGSTDGSFGTPSPVAALSAVFGLT